MKKIIALIAAAFVSATALAGEFADISIADLKKAIDEKKVAILDVNGSSSYKAGHVPTAIDFSANKADLAAKLPADKNTLIVAYCGGPSCSAYKSAATAAEKLGYKNIKHLSAGISGWKSAGEKLETPK